MFWKSDRVLPYQNLINTALSSHPDEDLDSSVDITSHSQIYISQTELTSPHSSLAIHLNSTSIRRDPWNISLPTEVVQCSSENEEDVGDDEKHSGLESGEWSYLIQKTTPSTAADEQEPYYKRWNEPALKTTRDVFDIVQQLLEVRSPSS